MAWWLCSISKNTPENWGLCKDVGLYGVTTLRSQAKAVEEGDGLVVWLGGRGYVARLEVTGAVRSPASRGEAPWQGGRLRFGLVIPFKVVTEVDQPVWMPFDGQIQTGTGFQRSKFLLSPSRVPDEVAKVILVELRRQAEAEAQSA